MIEILKFFSLLRSKVKHVIEAAQFIQATQVIGAAQSIGAIQVIQAILFIQFTKDTESNRS